MRGAERARRADLEFRRDMALLTAYFSGAGAFQHIDPKKALSWADFHRKITSPPQQTSNAALIAFFDRHAASAEPDPEQEPQ